jgi:hypothetical protein
MLWLWSKSCAQARGAYSRYVCVYVCINSSFACMFMYALAVVKNHAAKHEAYIPGTYVCMCMYKCACMYVCLHSCMQARVYMYVYLICALVCKNSKVYLYIYKHTHTYTYTYTYRGMYLHLKHSASSLSRRSCPHLRKSEGNLLMNSITHARQQIWSWYVYWLVYIYVYKFVCMYVCMMAMPNEFNYTRAAANSVLVCVHSFMHMTYLCV